MVVFHGVVGCLGVCLSELLSINKHNQTRKDPKTRNAPNDHPLDLWILLESKKTSTTVPSTTNGKTYKNILSRSMARVVPFTPRSLRRACQLVVLLFFSIPASAQFSNSPLVASFAAWFLSAAPTAPALMVRSRWVTTATSTARRSPLGQVI